jgi:hypothetical protein
MQAFLNIPHGVVVSESNGPQAFVPGHLEDLSRGMLSIRGGVGVNMQVDHRMILLKKGGNYNSQVVSVLQIQHLTLVGQSDVGGFISLTAIC